MSEPTGEDPNISHYESDSGLSVLGDLKSRRDKISSEQTLTLAVPRWHDPVIKVKYKPVPHPLVRAATDRVDRASKETKGQVEVDANIDILINGCLSVFAVLDDVEYSLRPGDPHGEHTKFDPDLAENLGLDRHVGARAVVKALFLTDADIISAAGALGDFSGYKNQEADEEFAGES